MADMNLPEMFARMASTKRQKPTKAQKKKTQLEKEVAELQKILDHEEKISVYLKNAVHESAGNVSHIPSFLPPKMREFLAELAMVESEIARLEGEISNLQKGLGRDEEVAELAVSNWKQNQMGARLSNVSTSSEQYPTLQPRHPTPRPQGGHLRLAASEAKAMYFINQAIKGDYPVSGFTKNEKNGGSDDQQVKNNQLESGSRRTCGILAERALTTQKLQRKPVKSSYKPSHEDDTKTTFNMVFSSVLSDPSSPGDGTQKWQPNKLSETIMKCLICIFTRLIRTTRAISMEVEKSGVITRSSAQHSSPISRSFRSENSSSSNSGLLVSRDFGQHDPYGIFVVEDSLPRDIGPYKNYAKFTSSSFDAKSISSCVPLLRKLRVLMKSLHNVDLRHLTYQQKLAFWINMYNACIMHGFLQFGLPSSPDKTISVMNKAVLSIGGNKLNALAIERFILRHRNHMKEVQWKGEKEDIEDVVSRVYGLAHPEPNVTFALSCGTRSSPAVRIYTADGISNELEKSKLEYLQASIIVKSTKTVVMPRLLTEFGKDTDSLLEWVCDQLPTSCTLRKSMMESCRGQGNGKIRRPAEIMPYESDFQYLLVV